MTTELISQEFSPGAKNQKKRPIRRIITALVVVIVLAGLLVWQPWRGGDGGNQLIGAETAPVRRGDLVITITESGSLKAATSAWVRSDIEASAQILKIIPEGARVKKGDWLCTLDTTNLVNDRDRQALSVEKARSAYEQAEADYRITLKTNESEIAAANLAQKFAVIDLEKFLDPEEGDRKVQIEDQDNKIQLAESEMKNAQETLEWSEKLYKKEYITKVELDRDKINHQRAELSLKLARIRKENLKRFDLVKQEQQLKADKDEAKLDLERVLEKCQQRLIAADTDRKSKKYQFELEEKQLKKLDDQIASGELTAPQDGLVVYAAEDGHWRRGRQDPIAEGVSVRYRQKIISLPDVSKVIVDVSIHESARSLVTAGQPATILVEALEGKTFQGVVTKMPEVPDSSSSWLQPDRKVFKSELLVKGDTSMIRPGMSARVKIFCDRIENCLYIPIQAVRTAGRYTQYAYVDTGSGPATRIIKAGKHNDKNVVILEGLAEGERVFLSIPPNAPPAPRVKEEKVPEIPQGFKIPTRPIEAAMPRKGGSDPSPAVGRQGEEGRSRRGPGGGRTPNKERILEMLKTRNPEMYEQVKDLSAEEIFQKMRELRSSRPAGEGRRRRSETPGDGEGGRRPAEGR